ncbi:glycosyltransferase [Capnocytophaga canis]|uniref:glycosyltransferase n=1 Tax=Capnocytophaga canis TaxID=1848903 RepID=UPI00370D2700
MKKMLFLCSRVPYPLVGGDKIRMFNSIKMLSSQYEIDLVYIDEKKMNEKTEEVLSQYCNTIYPFVISKRSHYLKTLKGLIINRKPLQVNYYYDKHIQRWIDKNIDHYDMVYCNHIRTTEYVRRYSICKIVDFVDSIAMNYIKAYEKSIGFWKLIYAIEKRRVYSYEQQIIREFEKKIVISEIDRAFMDKENKFSIRTIGNFVPDINIKREIQVKENLLSFLGKMDYEPNISAVCYFAKEIFPELKQEFPDLTFKIVGAFPTKEVLNLKKIRGIEVTGFVDYPYDCVQESLLFIAPMVSGAGVQNKILEAMKMEKCVVTTIIGAEGLENISEDQLVVCKNKRDMISNITHLINNKTKIKAIGIRAKDYVDRNYSEFVIKNLLLTYINKENFVKNNA